MILLNALRVALASSLVTASAFASPIQSDVAEVDGTPTQSISWTDAVGKMRTVHVNTNNHHIIRYEYDVDGERVVDDQVPGYGIGLLVNHGACGATNTRRGLSDYSAEAIFSGPHHYIWQSTFRLVMCDHPDVLWRVTNQYLFVTGEDHFIQTVTYDSSDLPESEPIGEDMRGPYNQTTWPGGGDISGFGWGSEYKFVTEGPIGEGDANVGGSVQVAWSWNEPNLIPYVWAWADPAAGGAVDREYGIVQNQPYFEQDFGGGFFGCGVDCFESAPPLAGQSLPAAWALPSQMNSYDSNYRSGRITWGQTYGTFENGHPNDTGSIPDMGAHFRPINAWSFTHVIGKYSDAGVTRRVSDTENAYASRLVASVGSVPTSGPRGPGDFVGPEVGSMPSYDWSNPGFDFIYRSWNVVAQAGAAVFDLDVAGGLEQPLFVVHGLSSDAVSVDLDGERLARDVDYVASHDPANGRLWISLQRQLPAGSHQFAVRPPGEEPLTTPVDSDSATSTSSTGSDTTGSGGSGPITNDTAATSSSPSASSSTEGGTTGAGGSFTEGSNGDAATGVAAPELLPPDTTGCAFRTKLKGDANGPLWPLMVIVAGWSVARRRSRA